MGSFDSTASGRFYQNACGEKPESTIGKLFIFNQPYDRNLTLSTFSVFLAVFFVNFEALTLSSILFYIQIAIDLLDTCITDDVMNEEGIGCDNITCTISELNG